QSLSAEELARAVGDGGEEILEQLATPRTRLVVAQETPHLSPSGGTPGGRRYALSHDRMAEVVVGMVEEEGQHGKLVVDAELLRLRRFVALGTALHRSGEEPAPRIPRRHFRRIAAHADALLWDDERRAWWAACRRRRRADRLRMTGWTTAAMVVLALLAAVVGHWARQWAEHRALLEQIAGGEPKTAFAALDRLATEGDTDSAVLLAKLRRREVAMDVLGHGLLGVGEEKRGAAVLRAVEIALPWVDETPRDPVLIANLVWALDFAPGRDPALAERVRGLRDRVLEPLRRQRPPPPAVDVGDPNWVEIPAGTFRMGAGGKYADEVPEHQVTISAFRLLRHEVTNAEYRRLVPDHQGADQLPAASTTWYEAVTYSAWLGGRLPTEAEWEYAARAVCPFSYCDREGRKTTVDAVAWTLRNSRDPETGELAPRPVMRLEPNPWGLYDMLGNLWEWTADWYDADWYEEYSEDPQSDPWGPAGAPPSGGWRVSRGGSFRVLADGARVALRDGVSPGVEDRNRGFRVLLPGRPEPLGVDL
ncbi:MAG: formylglycine-generating enzyme family protein, partial [bacterium]|nr:formylglycine-generating enzyme family protein [bacterium]